MKDHILHKTINNRDLQSSSIITSVKPIHKDYILLLNLIKSRKYIWNLLLLIYWIINYSLENIK